MTISRRDFSLASLFIFVSRCFARVSQCFAQEKPTRQMVKAEDSRIRLFSSEDLYRLEYLQERKVIIGNQKQNKLLILDLKSKTYTEKPYKPWASSAKITSTVVPWEEHRRPNPTPPMLPFDRTLFEIPAGFVKAKN